jgi:toxin ParE1/3/4
MSYILRPRATADLREISEYIADRNPDAGRTWLRSMVEVFELLGDYPALGHLRDDIRVGLRTYSRENYLIIFRRSGDDAVIVRIIHAARDWPKQLP